jgi:hypothetical protein
MAGRYPANARIAEAGPICKVRVTVPKRSGGRDAGTGAATAGRDPALPP